MADTTDILSGQDGDLLCEDGDLVIGDGTVQHQADLIASQKGEYKQDPLVGVGAEMFLLDDQYDLLREIRAQFERDGMQVDSIEYNETTGKLRTEAQFI